MASSSTASRSFFAFLTRRQRTLFVCPACRSSIPNQPVNLRLPRHYASTAIYRKDVSTPQNLNWGLPPEMPEQEDPSTYKPADTWDGLEHIGHKGDWREMEPTAFDGFTGFTGHVLRKASNREELLSCLHQAIVETSLTDQNLGKAFMHDRAPIYPQEYYDAIARCEVIPNGANGTFSLQWRSDDSRSLVQEMLFPPPEAEAEMPTRSQDSTDEASGEKNADTNPRVVELEDSPREFDEVEPEAGYSSLPERLSSNTFYAVPSTSFLAALLNLHPHPTRTHTLLKRLTQLSGHHIPDPLLMSSLNKPLAHFVDALTATVVKPPPAKLAQRLLKDRQVTGLKNLVVKTRRETEAEKETALGRWKVIERELTERGLPVEAFPRRKKVPEEERWKYETRDLI